jgi:Cu(I)/Ag(I) efflux system membrane fusion protein
LTGLLVNVMKPDQPSERPNHDKLATRGQEGIDAVEIRETEAVDSASGRADLLRLMVRAVAVLSVVALSLFLIGLAQRSEWIKQRGFSAGDVAASPIGSQSKRYICPKGCTPPSNEPGRCSVCGKELVEMTSGGGGGDGISITIEPSARRLAGIRTAKSKRQRVTRTIRTIGSIEFDESRLATISAYVDGRLETMYADYVGVRVSKGDNLALIYSPQLYTAQAEFLASLNDNGAGRFQLQDADLASMAREKLTELGMTDDQIETLQRRRKAESRIQIKSPQSGTMIEKSAVEGDYVQTGEQLFRIADLSTVWLMLDLFPDDAAAVRFGQEVEAEIQSVQGEVFAGRVAFIDPTVHPRTRTVRVRVEVMNFDRKLRPGDYATARITVPAIPTDEVYDPALSGKYISPMHPQVIRDEMGPCPLCGMDLIPTSELGFSDEPLPEQEVVTVPRDAVLLAGDHAVLYVETEPGRFEVRRVTVGPMNEKEAIVVEGLSADETVALDGNFLIDSQMQLAGNPTLLDPTRVPTFTPGPLELPDSHPRLLSGDAGEQFDLAFQSYFAIQQAMAADQAPPPAVWNRLRESLARLEVISDVPDEVKGQAAIASRAAQRMGGSLEHARSAFRTVSHAMLRAAVVARGPKTAQALKHYYCSMVPGHGGDWMQPGGELANPYWGSEMLTCGQLVRDLSISSATTSKEAATSNEAVPR